MNFVGSHLGMEPTVQLGAAIRPLGGRLHIVLHQMPQENESPAPFLVREPDAV